MISDLDGSLGSQYFSNVAMKGHVLSCVQAYLKVDHLFGMQF